MRIGISGANGHIGANLARALLKHGHDLRLMVHSNQQSIADLPAERRSVNLLDAAAVSSFAKGLDVFVHSGAMISIDADPTGFVRKTNIEGTQNVVNACVEAGIKRLIHFSSIHAFNPFPLEEELNEDRPLRQARASAYDDSKVEGERIALAGIQQGLEVVVIAPTSVYGPHDYYPSLLGQAIQDIYHGRIPMLIPGGYNFVFVEDLAKGTIAAIEKGRNGEKYLLSGEYKTIKDFANCIGKVGHRKVTQLVLPFAVLRLLLPAFKLHSRLTGKPALFTKESLKVLLESPKLVSCKKAEHELGYVRTPFEEGLRKTVEWFIEQN